jgi:hypothetical protein
LTLSGTIEHAEGSHAGTRAGLPDRADFRAALPQAATRATIPFNRKAEWGPDGRILRDAPVYSPFIRRKRHLELK